MSSDFHFIEFLVDGIVPECEISYRKMFGNYAMYCHGKTVALVCDNQLFVKITEKGKAFVKNEYEEGFPFPGAKPWMLIENRIENKAWISELFLITEQEIR